MKPYHKQLFSKHNFLYLITIAAIALSFAMGIHAFAATNAPTELTQTYASYTSVKLSWDASLSASKYYIELSDDNGNTWYEMTSSYSSNCTIFGLSQGTSYLARVYYMDKDNNQSDYSDKIEIVTLPEDLSTNIQQIAATKTTITLKWDAVTGANLYEIYADSSTNDYTLIGTTTSTSYTITGVTSNSCSNYYYVVPCRKSSTGFLAKDFYDYSRIYHAKPLPNKVTGCKKNSWVIYSALHKNYLQLGWNNIEKTDGYQIKVYNTKNKCIGTYYYDNNYVYIDDLKTTSCLYFKVRGYITLNNEKNYGTWSNKTWIVPGIDGTYTYTNGKMNIKWNRITGATGYDIYIKTYNSSNYKKVASVNSKTKKCTITKFKGKKISKEKNYYVAVVAKKKVGKKTYTSK